MAIITDATALDAPKDPEACTVFQLYRLFASEAEAQEMAMLYRSGGFGYGEAKRVLLKRIEYTFSDAAQRYRELLERPDEIEEVLRMGAERARSVAQVVLDRARTACGLSKSKIYEMALVRD